MCSVSEIATAKNLYFRHNDECMLMLRFQMAVLIQCLHSHGPSKVTKHWPEKLARKISTRSRSIENKNNTRKQEHCLSKIKSNKKTVRQNTGTVYPKLRSFKIERQDVDVSVRNKFVDFIKNHIAPFDQYFHPIIPSTNSCRMNYQSPQALRVFYGRVDNSQSTSSCSVRAIYGPQAVLKSNGPDPRSSYKVRPFTPDIEELASLVLSSVRKKDPAIGMEHTFNFLEIKIYIGDDQLLENGNTLTNSANIPLRLGCNKRVNAHNDLSYSDDGVQSRKDTACPDLPTSTFTIGSSRKLTFQRMTKGSPTANWSAVACKHWVEYELDDGSIFVLASLDDKPWKNEGTDTKLHKTKHMVEFNGTGVAFGFVFRLVRTMSTFDPKTDGWMYWLAEEELRDTATAYVANHGAKFMEINEEAKQGEISAINRNMVKYINEL